MKKKWISILLSASMAALVLAGCGGASKEAAEKAPVASNQSQQKETPAAKPNTSEEPCEIYMFINSPEYADAMTELIEAYKEVAPHVTINYETTQNDYPTLLKAKINSGDIPDIFASTSGKEIDVYREYSYDLTGQPLQGTIQESVADAMKSAEEGGGLYGIAIKGNYFGIVYNKDIFEECGITSFPSTIAEMKQACETISAKGYKPFTTGFNEWWVFKHVWQHYLDAAAENAGMDVSKLVQMFEKGEAKVSDYPELYNNFFEFIDLAVKYGDDKPLETALDAEISAFGTGKAAMVVGQGAWIEADVLSVNPNIKIGFDGYPVTDKAEQCQVISGSDQSLHVYKDSKVLQPTLDFVNWWYTSDYGKEWFTNVAGVVPPIKGAAASNYAIINQGDALSSQKGAAALAVCYSTDSWHEVFGALIQDYIGGAVDKDATCTAIETRWKEIEGVQ
ncbi:sugar ABC transporter substrate-binding protein [Sporanaerobium hydrogeniformans]|uniref:Sugar ABC transporter substrate-binding protein n=1 Tax=Sporanaerobium hydrogeniformans TaxID=3072179 RepID=A0AC61DA40_9FIRM|nr:extracellular solute-binding protein [Sporanaerobium hydrogeniformans]PHV69918.1 sugar ABC transporter substrate-binding protein [Sporanaerobium hydrogeniformans]